MGRELTDQHGSLQRNLKQPLAAHLQEYLRLTRYLLWFPAQIGIHHDFQERPNCLDFPRR